MSMLGPDAAAEQIPRVLFGCSAHSRQKRARMGPESAAKLTDLSGWQSRFLVHFRVRRNGGSVAFCVFGQFATLCLLGIGFGTGFGWPLGHPWATQGPPKRGAREALGSNCGSALFATRGKKGRVGQTELPESGNCQN